MKTELLALLVRRMVINGCTMEELESLAKLMKNAGVTQESAVNAFESSREHAQTEAIENNVLDVLDFITGPCPPWRRIY